MFAHHHRQHHPHRSSSPAMHYQLQYPHHHHLAPSPVSINGLRSSSPGPAFYVDLIDEHDREIGQRGADHASLIRPSAAGCGVEAMHYHPHHDGHGRAQSHEHEHPSLYMLPLRTSPTNNTIQDRLEAYARLDAQRRQEELEALQAQQQRRREQEERAIRAKIQAQLEAEAQRQREAEAEAEAELARRAIRFAAMQKERAEAQARIRAAQLRAQAQARAEAEAAQARARFEHEQQEKQQRIDSERKKAFFAQIMHQIHEQSVAAQEKHEAEQRRFVEHVQAQAAKRKLAIERMEREEEARQQEQEKLRQKQVQFQAANESDKVPTASKVNVQASQESKASKTEQKDEDHHIKPEEFVKFLLAQFEILPPRPSPTSASSASAAAPASKTTPSPVAAEDKKGKGRALSPAISPAHPPASASKPKQEQEPEHDVARSLATLEDIKNHFRGLSASFEEPEKLIFEAPAAPTASTSDDTGNSDSTTAATPALAFTASNRPMKNHEESLTRLLTELDEVQSFGLQTVKDSRKALAVQVQQELDRVDAIKTKHWEMQQTQESEAVHVEFSAAAETPEAAKEVVVEAIDKQEESLSNAARTSVSEEAAKLDEDDALQGYTVEDPSVTTDNATSTTPAVASADDTAPKPTDPETQLEEHLPIDSFVPAEDAPAGKTKDTTADSSISKTDAGADVNDQGAAIVFPARPLSSITPSTEPLGTVENAETVPSSADVQENAVGAIDQSAKQDDEETLVQEESANDGSETPATLAEEAETRIDTKSDAGSDTSSLKSGQKSPKATTVSDDDEDEDAEVHSETSFEWIE